MICVNYKVFVVYQKEPVEMAGKFMDMRAFVRFAKCERKRPVYADKDFQVISIREAA